MIGTAGAEGPAFRVKPYEVDCATTPVSDVLVAAAEEIEPVDAVNDVEQPLFAPVKTPHEPAAGGPLKYRVPLLMTKCI